MNVLSLFDGMSCGRIALDRANINISNYYASEIKKHAIKVAKDNYPNIIHIGDVTKIKYIDGILYTENGEYNVGTIDLLIGGSPCQDFSIAGLQLGLNGSKSKLFYEFLRIKQEVNPRYWLLENVNMKKVSKQSLDNYLGVDGMKINSNLFSYQNRERLYWTNIPYDTPVDKNITFQDYIGLGDIYEAIVNKTPSRIRAWNNGKNVTSSIYGSKNITKCNKIGCLTRKQDRTPNSGLIEYGDFCRFLTRTELEVAQTVPIGYTKSVSYNMAQDLLGDGWTVDVIAHILRGINSSNNMLLF